MLSLGAERSCGCIGHSCCGLGAELLGRLLHVARQEHIEHVVGEILPDNAGMIRLCRRLGFHLKNTLNGSVMVVLELWILELWLAHPEGEGSLEQWEPLRRLRSLAAGSESYLAPLTLG